MVHRLWIIDKSTATKPDLLLADNQAKLGISLSLNYFYGILTEYNKRIHLDR